VRPSRTGREITLSLSLSLSVAVNLRRVVAWLRSSPAGRFRITNHDDSEFIRVHRLSMAGGEAASHRPWRRALIRLIGSRRVYQISCASSPISDIGRLSFDLVALFSSIGLFDGTRSISLFFSSSSIEVPSAANTLAAICRYV